MEDTHEPELHHTGTIPQTPVPALKNRKRWPRMIIYILFVLFGQSGATLLGRLYFNNGGKSIWLATLVGTVGFPVLIPISLYFSPSQDSFSNMSSTNTHSALILTSIYLCLGLIQAASNILYSIGLLYLPVSTYSLICATQLAFNAIFAFFLNAQKFTPFIVNSVVLLTISAVLLVFQSNSENPTGVSRKEYSIGFIGTVIASALYSLNLSLTQLTFQKVLKSETLSTVLNMIIYQALVATSVTTVTLFASGDWNNLVEELEEFKLGKLSYVLILVWITVGWQAFSIGTVGLTFEVSSLFSNVISTFCLPIVPILAAIYFQDRMDGQKVVAILLAIWGFVSYLYQHYLDH